MLYELNVPKEKLEEFHSLLCNCRGHYCSIPDTSINKVVVKFEVSVPEFFKYCAMLNIADRRKTPRSIFQRVKWNISHLIHMTN